MEVVKDASLVTKEVVNDKNLVTKGKRRSEGRKFSNKECK